MNTKTKKVIAKEIIYFFSVVAFLLLIWAGIEIRNSFFRKNINNFSKEISDLKIQIDSIEKTYPKKAKSLYELMGEGNTAIQKALYDFNATINVKPNLTDKELFEKFPEFHNDISKLQSAKDYSATLNSGKYKNVSEFNNKFPDFFGVEKEKPPFNPNAYFEEVDINMPIGYLYIYLQEKDFDFLVLGKLFTVKTEIVIYSHQSVPVILTKVYHPS